MMTKKGLYRDIARLSLGIGIALGYVFCVYQKAGICFETNDDRFLAEILSGVLSAKPDAHAVFINYLLALPLSALYRLTAAVPWYGGALVCLQVLSYGAMLDAGYSRCERPAQYLAVTAGGIVLLTGGVYIPWPRYNSPPRRLCLRLPDTSALF